MADQVENLINILVRADARERVLEADNERLRDENAELEDTVHRQGNRLDSVREDLLLKETANVRLEGVISVLKDEINELRGAIKIGDIRQIVHDYFNVNNRTIWEDAVPLHQRETFQEFVAALANERKIDSIKALRKMTNCGLKEGKEVVESILDGTPL